MQKVISACSVFGALAFAYCRESPAIRGKIMTGTWTSMVNGRMYLIV